MKKQIQGLRLNRQNTSTVKGGSPASPPSPPSPNPARTQSPMSPSRIQGGGGPLRAPPSQQPARTQSPMSPSRIQGGGGPLPAPPPQQPSRAFKKGGSVKKPIPKGMHKMPDGSLMKNSDMAGRAMKKKGSDAKGRAMKSGKTGYGGLMAMGMKKGGKAKKGM